MQEQSTFMGSQKILPSNSIPRETTELNYPRAIREECSNGCLSPWHTKNKGSMSGAKSLVNIPSYYNLQCSRSSKGEPTSILVHRREQECKKHIELPVRPQVSLGTT